LIVELTILVGSILLAFYAGYFLLMLTKSHNAKRPNEITDIMSMPSISVVVPTYNEENAIVQKLTNLMEQDSPSIELIVVDSASKDKTVELIQRFVKDNNLTIKLVRQRERKGKASALNLVFEEYCSGEIVVITDADAIWEKDALRKLVSSFSDSSVGAVTGKQVLLNPNQSLMTGFEKSYRSVFDVLRIGETRIDSTPIFNGPLMAFRSSLLEPIPEDTIADDSHLAVAVRKKGFRSVYASNALFYEYAPPTPRSRFAQKLRRAQGLVQLFLRQRGMFFNRKYGKYGAVIFPAEFFMHVVSPVLLVAFLACLFYSLLLVCFALATSSLIILAFIVAISIVALAIKGSSFTNFILTFLDSQLILLIALFYHLTGKSQHKWEKVPEIGKLWKENKPSG
jgi:cellulose synthase/poly-beta-1,6-N-acetylglucosamine synthase-like glycosyltransferase